MTHRGLLPKGLLLVLLLWCGSFNDSSWAESGSSQAVMVLFVPPTDTNMLATTTDTSSSPNAPTIASYNSNTSISLIQQNSQGTYRVWMDI